VSVLDFHSLVDRRKEVPNSTAPSRPSKLVAVGVIMAVSALLWAGIFAGIAVLLKR
jgi:hypothetical protein